MAGLRRSTGNGTRAQAGPSTSPRRPLRRSQFTVAGLTCGQCVGRLMDALLTTPGVSSVSLSARYGADSAVTVASTSTLDLPALRAAVTSAGFTTTPRHHRSEPSRSRKQDRS